MIVHSSIPFKIISVYPSIEHKDKIAVSIAHPDGRQEVLYLSNPTVKSNIVFDENDTNWEQLIAI